MYKQKMQTEDLGFAQTHYDRTKTTIGVVHIGVGSFHRAHQAVYLDNYMDQSGQLDWAIAGVNLRKETSPDIIRLRERDGEYFLKTLSATSTSQFQLVRSHKSFFDWTIDPQGAEEIIAQPQIKLISVTVTESGYYLGEDGRLDIENIAINNELNGTGAGTVYGYLRNSLTKRMEQGNSPLTILCCDNLRENGKLLQENLDIYLEARGDHELVAWLKDYASFPCSMVDRITPRPNNAHALEVENHFGVKNDFTIHSEDFIQWVITDDFRGERPELELAGVSLVNDVTPYEEAKIRILNGGHLGLAYLGALKGFETFDKVINDPELSSFFDRLEQSEIVPSLDQNSPVDLEAYPQSIKARFQNWQIADGLPRLAMDGYSKFRLFLLPTIMTCFDQGKIPDCAIKAVASWYVLIKKVADGKSGFNYTDPYFTVLEPYLQAGQETAFAKIPEIWCDLPIKHSHFPELVAAEIKKLQQRFDQ